MYCLIAESVRGFKEILEGKHDDLPESACYMASAIDEAAQGDDAVNRIRAEAALSRAVARIRTNQRA